MRNKTKLFSRIIALALTLVLIMGALPFSMASDGQDAAQYEIAPLSDPRPYGSYPHIRVFSH